MMKLLHGQGRHLASVLMAFLALAVSGSTAVSETTSPSHYAGEERRAIKALSDEKAADLLAGRGMGYALAAELNRYPGPLHVIELADQLDLSAEQRDSTEEVFRTMQAEAKFLGEKIVAAERGLDAAFANGTIDQSSLTLQTTILGELYGRVRASHLAAHLEMKRLLTPPQIASYDRLRGYAAPPAGLSNPHLGHH